MNDSILNLYHGGEVDPLRPVRHPLASADGWLPGPPDHLTWADLRADLLVYGEWVCECGASGPRIEPQHRGERYRLLLVCKSCDAETIA